MVVTSLSLTFAAKGLSRIENNFIQQGIFQAGTYAVV
jgi:hypothetical protein